MTFLAISLMLTILVWFFSSCEWRTRNLFWLGVGLAIVAGFTACDPTQAKNIFSTVFGVIADFTPFIASLGSSLLPGEAGAISGLLAIVLERSKALESLVSAYDSSPSDTKLTGIQAVVTDIHSNLPALEDACNVKNAAAKSRLQAVVWNIQQILAAAEARLVKQHPQVMAAVANAQQG